MRFFFVLLAGFLSALPSAQAADCSNPQSAVNSLFVGLGLDAPKPSDFCFDRTEGDQENTERLANQLLQVIDARGLFIQINNS